MSFVKDFYRMNLKIDLSEKIYNWARPIQDSNKLLIEALDEHFILIDTHDIQYGDVVVSKPSHSQLLHLGVCDKSGYLQHHPIDRYPKKDLLHSINPNQVYKIYRYKDL